MINKYKLRLDHLNDDFNEVAGIINEKIGKELADSGYHLHIVDDYLGIEGYMAFYSHPTRVTQLMLCVNSEFEEIDGDYFLTSIYVSFHINRINISTPALESIVDFPESGDNYQMWDTDVGNVNDFSMDLSEISINTVYENLFENIFTAEQRFFDMFKKLLKDNNFENIYGKIGDKESVFKSIEDVYIYLENFDIDPIEFGINENIEILMPSEVKDIFLF